MMLNQELILTRCQEIEDSLERIKKIKEMTKEEFLKDKDAQDIACYRLLITIESALNLCYHISAKYLKKVPDEYAECFVILFDAGIIPEPLSKNLQKMARFRNLLVHMYWKIDYATVYDIIKDNIADIHSFSRIVVSLL